jgi:hypothetical protein
MKLSNEAADIKVSVHFINKVSNIKLSVHFTNKVVAGFVMNLYDMIQQSYIDIFEEM